MPAFRLGTASQATGCAKSTILRATKAGRLSATRDDIGQWAIDPSKPFRVFPALALPATAETAQSPRMERDATADVLVAELRQVIADLRRGQDDLQQERDKWQAAHEREQAAHAATQRLLLPPRPQRLRHRTQRRQGRAERLMERRATGSYELGAGCARLDEGAGTRAADRGGKPRPAYYPHEAGEPPGWSAEPTASTSFR
jgi:hypothetical protein